MAAAAVWRHPAGKTWGKRPDVTASAAASPRLFAVPDFRRLWCVGLIVFLVRWLEMLAVSLFVYQATGSAFLVTMMGMLRILPMGLFGALLGAMAERVEARTALLGIVLASLLTSLVLAALAWRGMLAVWHLAVASFINGLGWAADNPVRRMMIGQVVGPTRMGAAMSADVGSNNASRMLGPTLSGLIFATVGIEGAFVVSVLLYLARRGRRAGGCATAAACSRRAGRACWPASRRASRWCGGTRGWSGTLVVTVIFNIFGWPFTSLIPVVGQDHLRLGPEAIGVLASMDGVGAFAGALAMAAWAQARQSTRAATSAGWRIYFAAQVGFALAPHPLLAGAALLLDRLRPGRVQHHAGDAGLPAGAGRGAQPGARAALGLHRAGADRLRAYRAAGGCARGAMGLRHQRGGGVAGPAAHAQAVAPYPGSDDP